MKNNRGFATSFMLFGILILFLILLSILLFTMNNSTTLENKVKSKVIEQMDKDTNVKAINVFYDNSNSGSTCETVQCVINNISRLVSNKKLCIRVKKQELLHKSSDGTIFGQLGTKGSFHPGDAFDCDVNGDGIYDNEQERFYYVSDYYDADRKVFNTNYATLIYYSNVINGEENNKIGIAYYSQNIDNMGPLEAIKHLPTTTQWKNITLYKTKRKILNHDGNTSATSGALPGSDNSHPKFDYSGYAARLLEFNENDYANKNGNPIARFENTKKYDSTNTYGYWLENPCSSANNLNCANFASTSAVISPNSYSPNRSDYVGVRPVIDVKKNDIEY